VGFRGRDGALRRPRACICPVNGSSRTLQRSVPTMGMQPANISDASGIGYAKPSSVSSLKNPAHLSNASFVPAGLAYPYDMVSPAPNAFGAGLLPEVAAATFCFPEWFQPL